MQPLASLAFESRQSAVRGSDQTGVSELAKEGEEIQRWKYDQAIRLHAAHANMCKRAAEKAFSAQHLDAQSTGKTVRRY
jgi:hypothetical protein